MTSPRPAAPSPLVRFPSFTDLGDLNSLSIVIQDLSIIYDVTAVAVLPGYGRVRMPSTRLGPRRWSPLRAEDRLKVKRVSLASPLEIVFFLAGLSTAVGSGAIAGSRVLRAVKAWVDVLAAGVDLDQREQALEENRALAPERLREAQLSNALREQQLRRVTAEADIIERARNEILGLHGDSEYESASSRGVGVHRDAGSLTSIDFAELLDEPMQRLLGYGGGELEVVGDEYDEPEPS